MQKSVTFSRRINTIFALAIVFLLVLATNRIDQKHFETAQQAVNEVYKDRVLVQGYIFSISNTLRLKQLGLKYPSRAKDRALENTTVDELLNKFEQTRLTRSEAQLLAALQSDYKKLKVIESSGPDTAADDEKDRLLNAMQDKLSSLSEIQIHESRSLIRGAQKSLDLSALLSNIELLFVIVIGVILQILMFYRSRKIAQKTDASKSS